MPRCRILLWVCLFCLPGCAGTPPATPPPVRLFAAASTKEAVEEIARDFTVETGIFVDINLGSSSALAKQVEHGGGADVFLSADEASADYLAGLGLVEARRNVLTNRLVLVVPAGRADAARRLEDLAGEGVHRLALASPGVPAGRYARQALERAGILAEIREKVVEGADVRATLQYLVRGEADAGIVYATDVIGSDRVRIACQVDSSLHAPIRYPLVLLRRDDNGPADRRFYDYVTSDKAIGVFRKAGFGLAL